MNPDPGNHRPPRESWLGVDYGARRIGLAHADEVRVAVPLAAATGASAEERLARIEEVAREKAVRTIILGHPVRPDGTSGPIAEEVEAFGRRLEERLGLPVVLHDERDSSREAAGHWNLRKARRKRKTGQLDSAAAAVILRGYLEEQSGPGEVLLAPEAGEEEDPPHA